ncbi:MAG TPA: BtpA/SgcQ family protein [Longimicrobiales bacterium]|nr:BtpA/SgcQ family protein [Longimicrobiales bacterium]
MVKRLDPVQVTGAAWPIIGMVHLRPLPGAPAFEGMGAVLDAARRDAEALADGGVDAVLVENFGDVPFHPDRVPPETVAAMTRAVLAVRDVAGLPIGVNVLRNDARSALAVAAATDASFMRVNVHTGAMLTDQGWISGRAHDTLRERARLGVAVAILADILVKHAVVPAGLDAADAARDTWERGRADALIVSGPATGHAVPTPRLVAVRAAVPDAPLLIGSGLDEGNAGDLAPLADGAIVGSAFQRDGRAGGGVDPDRVRRLVRVIRAAVE